MSAHEPVQVILVDPSLFTAPYDAALTDGLVAACIEPTWAVRPTRVGDGQPIASKYVDAFFYRHVDRMTWLPEPLRKSMKGLAHAFGLVRLASRVARQRPYTVHFQWAVIPLVDALAMLWIRRFCPVILTVHDTTPFNGDRLSFSQGFAYDLPMRVADRIIVHTEAGRQLIVSRGVAKQKINVIPHGPLQLVAVASRAKPCVDPRWTFLLFGELKAYKGIGSFVEAIAILPPALREQARFVIAGRPRMELGPLRARIAELGIERSIELQPRRLAEQEMADLFDETDCFVFPYSQVDASGVYFLVKSLSKWLIACNVGVFAEDLRDGIDGTLVPVADTLALAAALESAIKHRPSPSGGSATANWLAIGEATRAVYEQAQAAEGAQ